MAELSLLVERARARVAEDRDREGTEQAREDLKRTLDTAPAWAWPLVMLAPPTDSWRRVWAYSAAHSQYAVSLELAGATYVCRLMSVNLSRVCVLTRAPVAGGEMGMLKAAVPNEPVVISARIGVEGVFERFLSGLAKRPMQKLLANLTGPRRTPVLAVLRLLDSGPDPDHLPRPGRDEKVADTMWTPSDPEPIRLPPCGDTSVNG